MTVIWYASFPAPTPVGGVRVLSQQVDLLRGVGFDARLWLPPGAQRRHWDKARTAAGRPDLHFQALRHYAGTRYAQSGATLRETMDCLGQSTTAAAMRYQHAGNRDEELAMRAARRA